MEVTDDGGTIRILDGTSVSHPEKNKVVVRTIGNDVRIQWDDVHYVQANYQKFTAPTGVSAIAVCDAIAAFLDTNPSSGVSGSGTQNYIPKWASTTSLGNSQIFDNGVTVSIGTATGAASALFDVSSTTKGFLLPRMTTTQRDNIAAPATGLLVYNTTTSLFNFYSGAAWVPVGGSSNYANGGNAFAGNATIGLTDNFRLDIITNNTAKLTVLGSGFVGIGTTAPGQLFTIRRAVNDFLFELDILNNSAGDNAATSMRMQNDVGSNIQYGVLGSGNTVYTTYGSPSDAFMRMNAGDANMNFILNPLSSPGKAFRFYNETNVTSTPVFAIFANRVVVGQRLILATPDGAIADGSLSNGQSSPYLDETGNLLIFKVKYAGGTVKTGSVALL